MAKVQIKSEKITLFGGIFHVREQFYRNVGPIIDKVLGFRCTSFGYQYSEIVGLLSRSQGDSPRVSTMTRDIFFINLITFQASVWFLVSSPHG